MTVYERSASASLSLTANAERTYYATRGVQATLIFSASDSRSLEISRSNSASLSLAANSDRYINLGYEIKQPSSSVEVYLTPEKLVSQISSSLKVFAYVIDEGYLNITHDVARLDHAVAESTHIYNTIRADLTDNHKIVPLLKSAYKVPQKYLQGHRFRFVTLYVLGRSTTLDAYLDEDGDSREIPMLILYCYDMDGNPAQIYISNAYPVNANPVFTDREQVVYAYNFLCDKYSLTPHIGLLKMVVKPVTAGLMIILIHPEIRQPSSLIEIFVEQDAEETKQPSSSYKIFESQDNSEVKQFSSVLFIDETSVGNNLLEVNTSVVVNVT